MTRISSALLVLLAACANARPEARTIEPQMPGSAGSDDAFVLSRDPEGRQPTDRGGYVIHLEGEWFPFRARYLDISEADARLRDSIILATEPPKDFWDEQTAVEAVSIWSALCNECHGGRRRLKDSLGMPAPAPAWGRGQGLFFGNKKAYQDVFHTISKGGPVRDGKPSEMPSWENRLAREQIWSLIYFLEYQSGGIEGRFPPSLHPRRAED
jgi:hypothetical protein